MLVLVVFSMILRACLFQPPKKPTGQCWVGFPFKPCLASRLWPHTSPPKPRGPWVDCHHPLGNLREFHPPPRWGAAGYFLGHLRRIHVFPKGSMVSANDWKRGILPGEGTLFRFPWDHLWPFPYVAKWLRLWSSPTGHDLSEKAKKVLFERIGRGGHDELSVGNICLQTLQRPLRYGVTHAEEQ